MPLYISSKLLADGEKPTGWKKQFSATRKTADNANILKFNIIFNFQFYLESDIVYFTAHLHSLYKESQGDHANEEQS